MQLHIIVYRSWCHIDNWLNSNHDPVADCIKQSFLMGFGSLTLLGLGCIGAKAKTALRICLKDTVVIGAESFYMFLN